MGHYQSFKTVIYCTADWVERTGQEQLEEQYAFMEKYIGVDKVYLEPYRDKLASKKQIRMMKKFFRDRNVEVSGGITTVTKDLSGEDRKRQRLFDTFCYSNEAMRNHLKKMVEYTAEEFDEMIIDDFFFTQCTCEDCIREKGERSWEEFRLAKMKEVSQNLVINPAKAVNPNIRIIIKYPNWMESYQETGYNPAKQREMFDGIYTGTESRHPVLQDQHLPRYLSYSLPRYMENAAPGRNGGGWFDPFECYMMDTYLEQAYLTCFSRAKEIMMFCWPALYRNRLATPLGFQLQKIDAILSRIKNPVGTPVYLPFNAQGEDHLEDYLGMLGIAFEPVCEFPEGGDTVFLTASALKDQKIISRLKEFVGAGGKAVVTSGFMIGALEGKALPASEDIREMTSIRYRGRTLKGNGFQISMPWAGLFTKRYVNSAKEICWPLLEHRNNASWSLMNVSNGDFHGSILLKDTYGKGQLITLNVPDMYSDLKCYPQEALTRIRIELAGSGKVYLDAPPQISLFTYDDGSFGVYAYTADGCVPSDILVHVREDVEVLQEISGDETERTIARQYFENGESVFRMRMEPGSFRFFKY